MPNAMDKLAKPLALFALLLTIGPPAWLMVAGLSAGSATAGASAGAAPSATSSSNETPAADDGLMTESRMKRLMAVGAALWFVAAPYWLKEDAPAEQIIEAAGRQGVP